MLMLLLVACQQAPIKDENSPRMRIPPGSVITLHQTLKVPAGHARVFLQNGKVVAKHRLNQYYPFCDFEIRSVSDGTLQITADTFTVTKVIDNETEVVSTPSALRHVAWGMGHEIQDDGMPMVTRSVQHRLHSPRQPQVMRLTCYGGFSDPWKVAYPTITEIRHALGEIATVKLAGS